jgi:hypothetical protein
MSPATPGIRALVLPMAAGPAAPAKPMSNSTDDDLVTVLSGVERTPTEMPPALPPLGSAVGAGTAIARAVGSGTGATADLSLVAFNASAAGPGIARYDRDCGQGNSRSECRESRRHGDHRERRRHYLGSSSRNAGSSWHNRCSGASFRD